MPTQNLPTVPLTFDLPLQSDPPLTDRARLEVLLGAIDASPRALRCDQCGDYAITGKLGRILVDGQGFLFFITTNGSPRRWTFVKRRLAFCHITQDGDDEGCLHLDKLPTPTEAKLIREALGIRKKRRPAPMPLKPVRSIDKTPPGAPACVKRVGAWVQWPPVSRRIFCRETPLFPTAMRFLIRRNVKR
jgi:hypothetical protein